MVPDVAHPNEDENKGISMPGLTLPPEQIEPKVDTEAVIPGLEPLEAARPSTEQAAIVTTEQPVVATEQEVILSTAVVLGHTARRQSRTAAVAALFRRTPPATSEAPPRERRYYPERHSLYEDSRMDRERYRL